LTAEEKKKVLDCMAASTTRIWSHLNIFLNPNLTSYSHSKISELWHIFKCLVWYILCLDIDLHSGDKTPTYT
jgi:hypothetical protein